MIKSKLKAKMIKSRRALAFLLTNDNPPSNTLPKKSSKQQGFTLIELLVVVSILAALAGLASVAMDGYQQESEETITLVEMQRIANAIRRFKADTGYWPKDDNTDYTLLDSTANDPANLGFLFSKPADAIPEWTPEYAIGWHGPYVNFDAIRKIGLDEINTSPGAGCNGVSSSVINNSSFNSFDGLVDRFQQIRTATPGTAYCVLTREKKDPSKLKVAEYSASPYLYEAGYYKAGNALCPNNANKCVAIRSFGSNGIDDEGIDASDDIVFVLQQNP